MSLYSLKQAQDGGGFQAWILGTGQTLTNSGTRRCSGGGAGSGGSPYNAPGAPGGAGAVLDLQFSDMGWT